MDTSCIRTPLSRSLAQVDSNAAATPASSRSRKYPRGMPSVMAEWRGVASGRGALPRSTSCRMAASATDRQSGPTVSSDQLSGTMRSTSTSPNEGLSPTRPQAADGMRIEPPVSVPMDAYAIPAATDTAEPPDEPPGDRVGSCGCFAGP